jgi:hypothetical protein
VSNRPVRRQAPASPWAAALAVALLATGCGAARGVTPAQPGGEVHPASIDAFPPATTEDRRRAAQLAHEACAHGTTQPLVAVPPGQGQPTLVAYDLERLRVRRAAILGGQAAAQDRRYNPLAAAARDLREMYDTARLPFSAVLGQTATAEERRSLHDLQAVATQTADLLNRACRSAP